MNFLLSGAEKKCNTKAGKELVGVAGVQLNGGKKVKVESIALQVTGVTSLCLSSLFKDH